MNFTTAFQDTSILDIEKTGGGLGNFVLILFLVAFGALFLIYVTL